jgi:hypothetical protein
MTRRSAPARSAPLTHHPCPLLGCATTVPRNLLMCGYHWSMVPPGLRAAVWGAYDNGRGIGTRELSAAQSAAITAVREQLAGGGDA